ncbi:MAG: hypothetical protein K0B06_03265 [Brevefilum sp.]|nr:hypothetical protein [Brevefilum sp.]
MKTKVLVTCILILFLSACGGKDQEIQVPTLDATRLNETAVSLVTEDYAETQAIIPTETPTPTLTQTPIPTLDRTRPPLFTPTSEVPCNQAAAGRPIDVTIPDDTKVGPGQPFSKTWRLENVGACTWTRLYTVTFFSGNSLGARYTQNLQQPVNPGDTVDITVDMLAPQNIGLYQSNWMLSDPDGGVFGIGPHGDAPFWVRIEVVQFVTSTPTVTPTITRTPVVFVTGDVRLGDGDQLDLDRALLNPDDSDQVDLVYQYGGTPIHQLIPANDAVWAAFGDEEPSFGACVTATLTNDPISFNQVPAGTYYCYRTSDDLPGWLLIVGIEGDNLVVRLQTWAAP